MPKLRSYRLYKNEFKAESYVIMHLPKFERSLVAQLRAGILPLKLETGRFKNIKDEITGRYRKIEVEERICDFCKNGVEDEVHFICCCPINIPARNHMFEEILAKKT